MKKAFNRVRSGSIVSWDFVPPRRSIQKLTESEEEKISRRKSYRTTAATLRRLAAAPMILEMDERRKGDWDRFQVRNIGLAVQRLLAEKFDGDVKLMRKRTVEFLADNLGVDSRTQGNAFPDFAYVVALIPGSEGGAKKRRSC
jgi:hypothetical protein